MLDNDRDRASTGIVALDALLGGLYWGDNVVWDLDEGSARPFYDAVIPLSWLIVRVAVGWNLLVHGWGKIMAGPTAAYLKGYGDIGFTPPELWFWSSTVVETTAGVALILGLFTRFFAAATAIEMLIITVVYWKTGFAWTRYRWTEPRGIRPSSMPRWLACWPTIRTTATRSWASTHRSWRRR